MNWLSHRLLTKSILRYILVYMERSEAILLLFFYLAHRFYLDCERFNDFELLLLMFLDSGRGIFSIPTGCVQKRADTFLLPLFSSSAMILPFRFAISISYMVRSCSSASLTASFFELFSTSSWSMSYNEYFHFQNLDQIGCLGESCIFHF